MFERTSAQSAALAAELRNLIRLTEGLVGALSEDRDAALLEMRARVGAALVTAKERLAAMEERARQAREDAAASVDVFVRKNPWTTAAAAAALGLIVGAWMASPGAPGER